MNLHLISGVQYRNTAAIVQSNVRPPTHLQEHFQMFFYEEFLRAMVELGQMKTEVYYIKQCGLQVQIDYSQTNVMDQMEPLGKGVYFRVSLIVQQLSCM